MQPPALPPKPEVANALLEGPSVFVHLDPRGDDVSVPKWFKKQSQLVLQIGLNMAVPIPDLDVGEEGISCTLSFNRSPFWCFLPWKAIFALVGEDGRGMVWPEDVPPDMATQGSKPQLKVVQPAKRNKKKRLAVVDAPADSEPSADEAGESTAPTEGDDAPAATAEPVEDKDEEPRDEAGGKKLPPYLRVIK